MRLDDMSRTEIEFLIDEWIHKERGRTSSIKPKNGSSRKLNNARKLRTHFIVGALFLLLNLGEGEERCSLNIIQIQ